MRIMNEKKRLILILSGIALALFVIAVIVIAMMDWGSHSGRYDKFDTKRTAEMESRFGIIINGDITLKEYRYYDWQDNVYILLAENIGDYHSFMKQNLNGKVISLQENGIFYDYEKNTQSEKHTDDSISAVYFYRITRDGAEKECRVIFEKAGNGKFNAEFRTW